MARGLGHQSEAYFATQRFSCSSKAMICWNVQGLGSHKCCHGRRDKTATALNPLPAHCSLQEPSSTHPACFKSARDTREVVLAPVGNRHTFLIPQLTKEPLPGFAGRSSTTPSLYSKSSSTRMWWGLSRGFSSPRTAGSKEVLGGKHSWRCRCPPAPSLSVLKWGRVLAVPHTTTESSGRRETNASYLQTSDPHVLEKRISSSTCHQRKTKCKKVFLWNLDLSFSPV